MYTLAHDRHTILHLDSKLEIDLYSETCSFKFMIFIRLYRLLFVPVLVLVLPYYLRRMWRRGGYKAGFANRFGIFNALPKKQSNKRRIWLQAVSVGELLALESFIQKLKAQQAVDIILTVTTSTGYRIAQDLYAQSVSYIGVFPLDFWPCSRMAWNAIGPDACILMEGELWPEHIYQATLRHIPIYVMNARLSPRSFKRYTYMRLCMQSTLQSLRAIYASSPEAAQRYEVLGVPKHRIHMVGNLKFDKQLSTIFDDEKNSLKAVYGLRSTACVLVGASTWPGEEQLLLQVYKDAIAQGLDCQLILVPRHAERRADILKQITAAGFEPWAYSQKKPPVIATTAVCLIDVTGALAQTLHIADIAFIGKSLDPHRGGQTPIEAAAAGVSIVYGPNMQNFESICKDLKLNKAAIQAQNAKHVHLVLIDLLRDRSRRMHLSKQVRSWYQGQQGATDRTLQLLALDWDRIT